MASLFTKSKIAQYSIFLSTLFFLNLFLAPIDTQQVTMDDRSLLQQFATQVTLNTSDQCKINCIDAGKNFCPSATHTTGVCCENTTTECSRNDICSKDIIANKQMMYWACPNEAYCGSTPFITPKTDGNATYLFLNNSVSSAKTFYTNKSCKYLISFPNTAGLNDVISIYVTSLDKVDGYIMTGILYQDNVLKQFLAAGKSYSITYPNKVFLVLLASQSSIGYFGFKVTYINNVGADIDQGIKDELGNISVNGKNQSKIYDYLYNVTDGDTDSSSSSSMDQGIIILIIVLGCVLLLGTVIAIVIIVYIKKRSEKVSEVKKIGNEVIDTAKSPMSKAHIADEDDEKMRQEKMTAYLKIKYGVSDATITMLQAHHLQPGFQKKTTQKEGGISDGPEVSNQVNDQSHNNNEKAITAISSTTGYKGYQIEDKQTNHMPQASLSNDKDFSEKTNDQIYSDGQNSGMSLIQQTQIPASNEYGRNYGNKSTKESDPQIIESNEPVEEKKVIKKQKRAKKNKVSSDYSKQQFNMGSNEQLAYNPQDQIKNVQPMSYDFQPLRQNSLSSSQQSNNQMTQLPPIQNSKGSSFNNKSQSEQQKPPINFYAMGNPMLEEVHEEDFD